MAVLWTIIQENIKWNHTVFVQKSHRESKSRNDPVQMIYDGEETNP